MIIFHGAIYLMHRTEDAIYSRARVAASAGLWVWLGVPGYSIASTFDPGATLNPLAKEVIRAPGAWLVNYGRFPWTIGAPVLAYVAGIAALWLLMRGWTLGAFVASSLTIAGIIATVGVSMFPFIMPSSTDLKSSLTVWDSASSHLSLAVMFWATIILMPLVIAYTSWAYKVMAGKVTAAYIRENSHSAY